MFDVLISHSIDSLDDEKGNRRWKREEKHTSTPHIPEVLYFIIGFSFFITLVALAR